MTIKLSTWHDELMVNVAGAPMGAIKLALDKAIAEFLRKSGAYAMEIPGIRLRPGHADYTIPKQPQGPILFIYGMYFEGRPLKALTVEQWLTYPTSQGDMPFHYRRYLNEPNRFTLSPTPMTATTSLIVPHVAFGYSPGCTENFPEQFESQWYDTILSGAIYRLCAMPGKPYTDATVATLHAKLFRTGIATARDQARKLFVRDEVPFRFPKWA